MKKQLMIVGIIFILITIGLCGCNEESDSNQEIIVYNNKAFLDYLSNGSYKGLQMPSIVIMNNTEIVRTWAKSTIQAIDENLTIIAAFVVSDTYKNIQNEHIAYYKSSRDAAEWINRACDAIDNEDYNTSLNYLEKFNDYTNQSMIHLQTSLNMLKEVELKEKILGSWLVSIKLKEDNNEVTYEGATITFFSNGSYLMSSTEEEWGVFLIKNEKLYMMSGDVTESYDYSFSDNDTKVTLIGEGERENWTIILTRQ